jgi:hypothetical protein
LTGWNPDNNSEIEPGDPIPAKPWLLVHVCRLESKGRGLDEVSIYSSKFVLVTHHVLSRAL